MTAPTPLPPRAWAPLLAVAFLAAGLTGCLSGGGEGVGLIPPPGIGDRFVYKSESGGSLTVEVNGTGPRIDGFQRVHQALILSIAWVRPEEPDRAWALGEAVDPGTGRVVQEIAWCGSFGAASDNRSCLDERGLAAFLATGLPGGLGAAPFWGTSIASVAEARQVPSLPSAEPVSVQTAPAGADPPGCLDLRFPDLDEPGVRRLHPFPTDGPITLCPDLPLPTRFQTQSGEIFELEDHELGEERITLGPPSPAWEAGKHGVALRTWTSPLIVHDPGEEAPLSVPGAHRTAMEEDEGYRQTIEQGGLVVGTLWSRTGSGETAGTIESSTVERSLYAVDAEGRWVRVVVERTEIGGMEVERQVVDRDAGRWDTYPTESSLHPQVASIQAATELGQRITGQALEDNPGRGYWVSTPGWSWFPDAELIPPEGPTVRVWLEDPTPAFEGEGLIVSHPYSLTVDGQTGQVSWVVMDRADLPLTEQG